MDGLGEGVQGRAAELSHLLLAEGLALLREQLGQLPLVRWWCSPLIGQTAAHWAVIGHLVPRQVARVLGVEGAEGGQQVLVRGGEELLLQDDPEH